MDKGLGRVSISKRFFYKFFKRAWDASFTKENIQSAFWKPGVWPVNGKEMIACKGSSRVKRPRTWAQVKL
jgi:hypothetical protein